MSVRDFMTEKLIIASPETKIFDAVELMNKNDIHRLPVLENGKLVGIITEGTIQEAMPSKATSLSVYEMNYLLNKTTVKDVMIKNVATIGPNAQLEDAIYEMRHHNVGVLPVLENNQLVGIITNNDIFDAFLKIAGYHEGGSRVIVKIRNDQKGVLAELSKLLADNDYSILTVIVDRGPETRIEFQLQTRDAQAVRQLFESAGYTVVEAVETNPV